MSSLVYKVKQLPINSQRLLEHLIHHGPTHRADLARSLGVSRTTITNLISPLTKCGLIAEIKGHSPQIKLPIATTPKLGTVASIVFFVDTCAIALATMDGRIFHTESVALQPQLEPEKRLETSVNLIKTSFKNKKININSLRGIHLAIDTQINTRTGAIPAAQASVRWYGVNPLEYLQRFFQVPIVLENSIRLSGLAEALWGAGSTYQDVLYLSIAMGATSSHINQGEIESGSFGGAGEFGHLVYQWDGPACACGNRGCIMQYITIPALLRDYEVRTNEAIDWTTFTQRAQNNNPLILKIVESAAKVCARGLINVCHLIDPEVIIINQAGVALLPQFLTKVSQEIKEHSLPLISRRIEILPSQLPDIVTATTQAGIRILRNHSDIHQQVWA